MRLDHSYATELAELCSTVKVTPVVNPKLRSINHELLQSLDLSPSAFSEQALFDSLFTPQGTFNKGAVAQKYGGHQFGQWNPELGDGRGLLLGEVLDKNDERWDLHLKGAGKTPYSRFGDGRAVLRSTIREYLASEALHGLGIPTSRALCLISSDEPVYRETQENAAMMIRVSQSHIRFGHFEYYFHSGQSELLQKLFDYTFAHHFPHLLNLSTRYLDLLTEIVESTARLIARWQAIGFNHGVMNTDNMSIHGITFDFGPYAFLDDFVSDYICNHSDHSGRYGFDKQPGIALWNLNALAHAFTPHLDIEQIKSALSRYEPVLLDTYSTLMRNKLGLSVKKSDDQGLVNDWLTLLDQDKRDYTHSFQWLTQFSAGQEQSLADHFIQREKALAWAHRYTERLAQEPLSGEQRHTQMQKINPRYVLRNYLAQRAIEEAEQGDFSFFERCLQVLSSPFVEQSGADVFAATPPDSAKSMEISCSS